MDCLSVCVWDHLIHGMTLCGTTWYMVCLNTRSSDTWNGWVCKTNCYKDRLSVRPHDECDGCFYEITWCMGWLNVQDYLSYGLAQCEITWHVGKISVWDHLLHKPGSLNLTLGSLKRSPLTSTESPLSLSVSISLEVPPSPFFLIIIYKKIKK